MVSYFIFVFCSTFVSLSFLRVKSSRVHWPFHPSTGAVKDSSSSASSTIAMDMVGVQNLDSDIPELPAPDIPRPPSIDLNGTVDDYDALEIKADGYLAPFGVSGSIALTTGGALANGSGCIDTSQGNSNSALAFQGSLKKSPR